MAKHTWIAGEIITKELLNDLEERVEAKAQRGEAGPQGPQGPAGPAGPAGPQGPAGKDAVIEKLAKVEPLEATDGEALKNAFNSLIADLKAKGYMTN